MIWVQMTTTSTEQFVFQRLWFICNCLTAQAVCRAQATTLT